MKKTAHPQHYHSIRIILLGILLIAVALVRINANALPSITKSRVLAYATSMNRSDLLAAANSSRAANGKAALNMNGLLNNSAQAKAQHMVDNNYWSHTAPDGTQPWYFFVAAGYEYTNAGENLAYGFDNAYAVNNQWMLSDGHRANILGDFVDVGFGIADSPNFQGGENTIVVAHYGTSPSYNPPPPPPPTPTPAPQPTPAEAPTAQISTSPSANNTADNSQPPPSSTTVENKDDKNIPLTEKNVKPVAPIAVGMAKNVTVLDKLKSGSTPGIAILSLVLILTVGLSYALTHRSLLRHSLATGENFAISHPTFDAFALAAALALILTATAARLQ